jgi:putative ubiquitin-RnfH superfamily antitoxin RatB of RatAB toxin-antitoxin module
MTLIEVSLVYSKQARQIEEHFLQVAFGTTASQAVKESGLLESVTDSVLQTLELGVWGKKVQSDYVLKHNDRIELYRPLKVDPKVARRERFAKQGSRGAGLFAKRRAGAKAGY